jgi:hypothetical protein
MIFARESLGKFPNVAQKRLIGSIGRIYGGRARSLVATLERWQPMVRAPLHQKVGYLLYWLLAQFIARRWLGESPALTFPGALRLARGMPIRRQRLPRKSRATGAALSLCVAGATAMQGHIAAIATEPVQRQWARLRSARLRRGPTIAAAAATTPTATMFARAAGTIRTEWRDAIGLWCTKLTVKSSALPTMITSPIATECCQRAA